jgi:hypothetical protein
MVFTNNSAIAGSRGVNSKSDHIDSPRHIVRVDVVMGIYASVQNLIFDTGVDIIHHLVGVMAEDITFSTFKVFPAYFMGISS